MSLELLIILLTLVIVVLAIIAFVTGYESPDTKTRRLCLEISASLHHIDSVYNYECAKRNMGNIPIYYINLDRSKKRLETFLLNVRKYIPFVFDTNRLHRVPGVDGKSVMAKSVGNTGHLNVDGFDIHVDGSLPTPGEIGCSLSHIKAILAAYRSKDQYALVVEDDVSFALVHMWPNTMDEIIHDANTNHKGWEIINMSSAKRPWKKRETFETRGIDYKHTLAYVVSRKGTEKLLNMLSMGCAEKCSDPHNIPKFVYKLPIRSLFARNEKFIADSFLYKRLESLNVRKFPMFMAANDNDDLNSTIHTSHTNIHLAITLRNIQYYFDKIFTN